MSFSITEALAEHRIIVAVRGVRPEMLLPTVEALYQSGIRLLEITYNQSSPTRHKDTPSDIAAVCRQYAGKLAVGAGTVLTAQEVILAKNAGAQFILSPNCDKAVIAKTKELGMGSVPGAMSPTEIIDATRNGGDVIKLFPCDCLGLPYIKALKAPVSHIAFLAMGGVNVENLGSYLQLVEGVGIGSAIVNKSMVEQEDFDGLTELARTFVSQLAR